MSSLTTIQSTDLISDSRGDINTNFSTLNTDKAEISGQTFTGQINFSGTDHSGIKLLSLTTVQRDALTPAAGMIIYNSTDDEVQSYENSTWNALVSSAANASTTVKGIVEIATDAELGAGTGTGGTGAATAATGSSFNATAAANKVPVAEATGQIGIDWLGQTTRGDIITNDGTNFTRLAIGGANTFLTTDGTDPSWGGANLNEANTFFGSTDISASEAETLTDASNADALHVHAYNKLLNLDTTGVTLTNTAAEETITSFTVPANTLGTGKGIYVYIPITDFKWDQSITVTLKVKYGATTIITESWSTTTNNMTAAGCGHLNIYLFGAGATSSQEAIMQTLVTQPGIKNSAGISVMDVTGGTSSEDSTGALTMAVTIQWSGAASTGNDFTSPMTQAYIITSP